ncbi:dormancy-associated protein homolog 3-like protein isoform X1 [Tanacetum coccineum]
MSLLDQLWDDTVAGPPPDKGLGKLRKQSTFTFRSSDSGKGGRSEAFRFRRKSASDAFEKASGIGTRSPRAPYDLVSRNYWLTTDSSSDMAPSAIKKDQKTPRVRWPRNTVKLCWAMHKQTRREGKDIVVEELCGTDGIKKKKGEKIRRHKGRNGKRFDALKGSNHRKLVKKSENNEYIGMVRYAKTGAQEIEAGKARRDSL